MEEHAVKRTESAASRKYIYDSPTTSQWDEVHRERPRTKDTESLRPFGFAIWCGPRRTAVLEAFSLGSHIQSRQPYNGRVCPPMTQVLSNRWHLLFCLVAFSSSPAISLWAAADIPMTGTPIPVYAPLDQAIVSAMTNSAVPGASVAVTKNGRLVYARGYGYADTGSGTLVQPNSLFRLASVSKVITAVSILHLVDEGKLHLDDKLVDVMNLQLPANADQRLNSVTIRMLLQYSAGWDVGVTGFWEFYSWHIATVMKVLPPPNAQTLFQYILQQPLQFAPGTRAVYENIEYIVLGRVIEKITGQNYEQYVRANVLAKMGIHAMRIGRTLVSGRLPGEVTYYDVPGAALLGCVYPGIGIVPYPYGGETIEAIDSFGGWVASTIDLLRLWNGIEGRGGTAFLSPASLQSMTAQPSYANGAASWWGFGVMVQDAGTSWSKTGGFPGTEAYVVRFGAVWGDGFDWAIIFNGVPTQADLMPLWGIVSSIVTQPAANPPGDLFQSYPSGDAGAAPTAPSAGVVGGATFSNNVAPGSLFSAFGTNFAMSETAASEIPLPTELGSVSVTINNTSAPLTYINSTQLNAQIPYEVAPGAATLFVRNATTGLSSVPASIFVSASAPGIFTDGQGDAIAQNQDSSLNTPSNGAIAGSVITLYMTGQGLLDNPVPNGAAAPVSPLSHPALPVRATIGGMDAEVLFAGMTPGLVGVMQVNVAVPPLPPGQHPVTVTIGASQSNDPNITIR